MTILFYIGMGIGAGFCVAGAVGAAILGRSSKKGADDFNGESDSAESSTRKQVDKSARQSTDPEVQLAEIAELSMRYRQLIEYARAWQEDAKRTETTPPTDIGPWEPFVLRWTRASNEEVEDVARGENEVEREFSRIIEHNRELV
jgi:hypothetical protein